MDDQNGKTSEDKWANPLLPSPPPYCASSAEAWIRGGINKRNAVLVSLLVLGVTSLHRSMNSAMPFYAPAPTENGDGHNSGSDWAVPLMMSTAAGMSTCLGAATVFLASERMGHAHLAFALSLAASVMMTVSVASILPEAFKDGRPSAEHEYIQFGTPEFVQRCIAFSVGSALYVLISRFAFPDPEDILELEATEVGQESNRSSNKNDKCSVANSKPDTLVARRITRSPCTSPINAYRREALDIPLPLHHSHALGPPLNDDSESKIRVTSDQTASSCFTKFTRGSDLQTMEARRAWRVAMLLFVSLAVHNFPEVNVSAYNAVIRVNLYGTNLGGYYSGHTQLIVVSSFSGSCCGGFGNALGAFGSNDYHCHCTA